MAAVSEREQIENGHNSEELDEKKERMVERIHRRQQERIAGMKIRQEERENRSAKNESVQYFFSSFSNEKAAIESGVEAVNGTAASKAELLGIFDELSLSVQKLQKFVTDSALFLSSYDIRHAQEEVTKLQTLVNEKREELMPKKKFAFKARKKATQQQTNENTNSFGKITSKVKPAAPGKENRNDGTTDAPDAGNIATHNSNTNIRKNEGSVGLLSLQFQCGLFSKSDEVIKLSASEIDGKDVGLTNLTSCTVQLRGSPSAVQMDHIINCKIFCGPVPGSVFVDNCTDSTLVLSCQQLRVHHTKDTQFYLHVTSRGIIEDTTQVRFAPYNWTYPGIEKDYEKSELDKERNNWDDIDDFNWLASDKGSPNWSCIPESERIKKWDTGSV